VRAGLVSDKAQGSAEALRDALARSGPENLDEGEFAQRLDRMAAVLTVDMHDEWTEVTLNVPVEDVDQAFALFARLLRAPDIGRENIERAAARAGPGAEDLGGESGAALYAGSMDVAVGHFHTALFDGHPYGARPTADDFKRLKPRAVREFHATSFVPGNTTLAIAGAIDPGDARVLIDRHFAEWPAGNAPEPVTHPGLQPNYLQPNYLHLFFLHQLQDC
jgi:predicted Zn-dependent peptidase